MLHRMVVTDSAGNVTYGNARELTADELTTATNILRSLKEVHTLVVCTQDGDVYFNPTQVVSVKLEELSVAPETTAVHEWTRGDYKLAKRSSNV